jgi:hypothetical protein
MLQRTCDSEGVLRYAKAPHKIEGFDPTRHLTTVFLEIDRYGCPLKAYTTRDRRGGMNHSSEIGKVKEVF